MAALGKGVGRVGRNKAKVAKKREMEDCVEELGVTNNPATLRKHDCRVASGWG